MTKTQKVWKSRIQVHVGNKKHILTKELDTWDNT